jgi:hypothetical protein
MTDLRALDPAHRAIVSALVLLTLSGCGDWGSGEKVGVITRLTKQGWFCPTWEAEIIRGGMNAGTGVMGQAFHFTVEDQRLVPLVQAAFDAQREVKITFHGERATFCRSDSNDYFLTKIVVVNQSNTLDTKSAVQPDMTTRDATLQRLLDQNQQIINELKR